MKKLLLFAAICFAWAAQAQEQTPYKVLRIHNGENITHIIKLAEIDSISFQLITPAPPEATYTITVEVDEAMGEVTGAGTYKKDEVVTLTATPKEGYKFIEWSDGITENPRMIIIDGENITLTALFTEEESDPNPPTTDTYTITVDFNEAMGEVTGASIYKKGETATLTATPKKGYIFTGWSDGVTDNSRTIIVSEDVNLKAFFEEEKPYDPFNGHMYIDLDLPSGLLWATCNVGANSPEDYGDYFAWGETEPKDNYGWNTYTYTEGDEFTGSTNLTKYCSDAAYGYEGYTDTLLVLEAVDDAATANWGGVWRTPTSAERAELVNNCNYTWTDNHDDSGVAGIIFTSRTNGNSIFLPAAGYYSLSQCIYTRSNVRYWSSSLYPENPSKARVTTATDEYGWTFNEDKRCNGLPIRPVCKPVEEEE